jgi:hypothetical protein
MPCSPSRWSTMVVFAVNILERDAVVDVAVPDDAHVWQLVERVAELVNRPPERVFITHEGRLLFPATRVTCCTPVAKASLRAQVALLHTPHASSEVPCLRSFAAARC